ncbi:TMM43-like protein [Mya arenaria]|uniref:TMM43-like protein n=1 Tax=Mya arenaria TaxID=6604 RepID=A0ABY7FUL4_MYAAR|nr:TMM43-like protein [Mya arenaria]
MDRGRTRVSYQRNPNFCERIDNPNIVSAENHGKLVHLIGSLQTDKELHDEAYNINVHAVKLRRVVEMFQWEEHETESDDVHRPQIGDTRVKFEYAGISGKSSLGTPDMVTIVARQIGEKLLPYKTVAGDTLELLYFGSLSPKAVFDREMVQNTMFTWGLRFVGWLLMFIGFTCLTSIVTTLVDWIPIVRDLVTMGVCLMNLSLSISLSLTIIAIGWIFYRPLLGFAILAMAATPFIMSQFRGQPARSRMD